MRMHYKFIHDYKALAKFSELLYTDVVEHVYVMILVHKKQIIHKVLTTRETFLRDVAMFEVPYGCFVDANGDICQQEDLSILLYKNPFNVERIYGAMSIEYNKFLKHKALLSTNIFSPEHLMLQKKHSFLDSKIVCIHLESEFLQPEGYISWPKWVCDLTKIEGIRYKTRNGIMLASTESRKCLDWYNDYIENCHAFDETIKMTFMKNAYYTTPIEIPGLYSKNHVNYEI